MRGIKMKKCTKCGEIKELSEFTKKKSRKDGLNSSCKTCSRATTKSHYERNKEYYKKKSHNHEKRVAVLIKEYKENNPCVRCGETRPWRLEFHHRNPSEKEYAVSTMIQLAYNTVLKEIEKCDVVCANCHRDIHYEEKMIL